MTAQKAREILREYRSLRNECRELRKLCEEYEYKIWRDDEDYRLTKERLHRKWLYAEKHAAEQAELIEEAIECLPSRERQALRLHYLHERTWYQVAVAMNYSEEYVRGNLHRKALTAFAAVYEELRGCGDRDAAGGGAVATANCAAPAP